MFLLESIYSMHPTQILMVNKSRAVEFAVRQAETPEAQLAAAWGAEGRQVDGGLCTILSW